MRAFLNIPCAVPGVSAAAAAAAAGAGVAPSAAGFEVSSCAIMDEYFSVSPTRKFSCLSSSIFFCLFGFALGRFKVRAHAFRDKVTANEKGRWRHKHQLMHNAYRPCILTQIAH